MRVRSGQMQEIDNLIQNKCSSNSTISCKESNIEGGTLTELIEPKDSLNNLNKSKRYAIPYLNLKLALLSARKANSKPLLYKEQKVKSVKPKSQTKVT
jgi:hypothetical protein